MNSQFMTEAELAEILKVSKSTLHKLRENGTIPFQLIGTCIRYNREDIDAWIKDKGHNQPNERV
jgi:excisionase family DNA binding protein